MPRSATGFVLGYHGCDETVAERLIDGEAIAPSRNQYDWLGWGAYFWENDPLRALRWSRLSLERRGAKGKPAVVGAIIELGDCLDLTVQSSLAVIETAFNSMKTVYEAVGKPMPENKDELRRPLDCAVLNFLYDSMPEPRYQTVRGVFLEGGPLFPGSHIQSKTHVQIAVRDLSCIRGVFRVPPSELAGFQADQAG
ncbi:hypothetical protein [Dongia sp.]|uniref:hypothetical protein n=1 Tax=Dongia sp. TaxID=1977262 RepID=UPI00374FFBAC